MNTTVDGNSTIRVVSSQNMADRIKMQKVPKYCILFNMVDQKVVFGYSGMLSQIPASVFE